MKKKILFSGPSQSIHLKRWCKFFKENNWSVSYVGFYNRFEEYKKYLDSIFLIAPDLNKISKVLKFKKCIKEFKPDIINFHYIDYKIIFSLFTSNIPIALTCYGSDVFKAPEKSKLFKKIFKFAGNRANLVLSIANHMTDELINHIGIKKNKIYTSSWGCNTKIFYNKENIKRDANIIRVICPRGFEPHYNWKTVMKAISLILEQNNNYEFIFTNSGSEEKQAKQMAEELNVDNNVKFLGRISPEKLAEEYNKSHIYISMSLVDGNNISLNEAMACGCFPICSDTPATRQWINNNKNGILLSNNFSENELAEYILNYKPNNKLVLDSKLKNYQIVSDKADFYKNLAKIEKLSKQIIKKNESN